MQQHQQSAREQSMVEQRSGLGIHRRGVGAGSSMTGLAEAYGGSGGEARPGGSGGLSAATKARLDTQANLQEGLTDELVGLAASLKTNTLAMEGKLRQRDQLLEGAEGLLDMSVTRTRASAAKAAAIHRRGSLNFCLQLLIMLAIGGIFAGMYVFIRVTRLAGYSAVPRAAPLPSPSLPPIAPVTPGAVALAAGEEAPLLYERHYEF